MSPRRAVGIAIVVMLLIMLGLTWLAKDATDQALESERAKRSQIEAKYHAQANAAQAKVTAESAKQVLAKLCRNGDRVSCDMVAKINALPAAPKTVVGPVGPMGPVGPVGPVGPRGERGLLGGEGRDGLPGAAGEDGTPGLTGPQGETGATGATGPAGPAGPQGEPGKDGADGQPGQSAYPFSFTFTVQTNPAQSTTYTVTCATPGEPCAVTGN